MAPRSQAFAPSMTSVTQTLQSLLSEAERARLVPALAQSTKQFEITSKMHHSLKNADATAQDIDALIKQLQVEVPGSNNDCQPHSRH